MAMNYFAFFPAVINPEVNKISHDKSGFFIAPAGPKGHYISIGGQGMSISSYSKNKGPCQAIHEVVYAKTCTGKMGGTRRFHTP